MQVLWPGPANLALGPRLVHGALAFWMQTTGAALFAVEQRSIVRLWTPAQDGGSAHGLLYPLLYGVTAASWDTVRFVSA